MHMLLTPIVPPSEVKRWTLDEYHRMIEGGYLGEDDPVELLEGWIVTKMPRNPPHDESIDDALYALLDILPRSWRIRIQCALSIAIAEDRKSTRLNSSHIQKSRMPSSA